MDKADVLRSPFFADLVPMLHRVDAYIIVEPSVGLTRIVQNGKGHHRTLGYLIFDLCISRTLKPLNTNAISYEPAVNCISCLGEPVSKAR